MGRTWALPWLRGLLGRVTRLFPVLFRLCLPDPLRRSIPCGQRGIKHASLTRRIYLPPCQFLLRVFRAMLSGVCLFVIVIVTMSFFVSSNNFCLRIYSVSCRCRQSRLLFARYTFAMRLLPTYPCLKPKCASCRPQTVGSLLKLHFGSGALRHLLLKSLLHCLLTNLNVI